MKLADLENRIKDIPTLPLVANHLVIESQRDTFTSKILASIIEKDPPLSAKLLKLANSAYYGFVRDVGSLDRAITLLGFNTVKNLACAVSVSHLFTGQEQDQIDLPGLWKHCLGTAVCARQLIRGVAPHLKEEAFLAGILHEIGTIIIINNFPDLAMAALQAMREEKICQSEAEKRLVGFAHEAAGAYLVDKWNFPARYYRIIRLHHNPPPRLIAPDDTENLLLIAVYAGNQLSKALKLGQSLDPSMRGVIPTVWKSLRIDPGKLQELKTEIRSNFEILSEEWLNE